MKSRRPHGSDAPLYLVTGGAGFIGSHLTETLAMSGQRVRVLDDFSSGKRSNLAGAASPVEIIEGDITDLDACRAACDGVDFVLHHAARVSVVESLEDPFLYQRVNALGTLNMLWAAREAQCRRFVYAGSASAYGNPPELPHREDMVPQPLSPYAVAKHTGELHCGAFQDVYGLGTVVLRYFNVFGPRQEASSPYSGAIARFLRGILSSEGITIFGDGDQSRDFVPVENVVAANLLACTAPEAVGGVINIGCGEGVTINQLVRVLTDLAGMPAEVSHGPARVGEVRHSVADIRRAKELLGYRVGVTVLDGLRRTIAWYRTTQHQDAG